MTGRKIVSDQEADRTENHGDEENCKDHLARFDDTTSRIKDLPLAFSTGDDFGGSEFLHFGGELFDRLVVGLEFEQSFDETGEFVFVAGVDRFLDAPLKVFALVVEFGRFVQQVAEFEAAVGEGDGGEQGDRTGVVVVFEQLLGGVAGGGGGLAQFLLGGADLLQLRFGPRDERCEAGVFEMGHFFQMTDRRAVLVLVEQIGDATLLILNPIGLGGARCGGFLRCERDRFFHQ